jgi:hypothetical protein
MSSLLPQIVPTTRSPRRPTSQIVRLVLQRLEDRIAPATFTVTTNGDTGVGSGTSGDLRYCITQANVTPGPNTLQFSNSTAGGATNFHDGGDHGISLNSTLPTIANDLTLDGTGSSQALVDLGGGTLAVNAGVTVTIKGGLWAGVTLDGSGTFATDPTDGAEFIHVTSKAPVTIDFNSGADQFIDSIYHGAINIAANINPATPVRLNGVSGGLPNQGTGVITVGANTHINATNFLTYGTFNLLPGTNGTTQLTNTVASGLAFGGGSQTFVSNVANVAAMNAGIDLNGHDAKVSGGLVNNGYIIDTSNGNNGTGRVVASVGAVVTGAGFYQNTVVTGDGLGNTLGIFEPGVGPAGSATFGSFHFSGPTGNTGVSNFEWQINDAGPSATYPAATGVAGPTPNAAGQVSGWHLVKAGITLYQSGTLAFDATPTDKLTMHLRTVLAPNDVNGNPSGNFVFDDLAGHQRRWGNVGVRRDAVVLLAGCHVPRDIHRSDRLRDAERLHGVRHQRVLGCAAGDVWMGAGAEHRFGRETGLGVHAAPTIKHPSGGA